MTNPRYAIYPHLGEPPVGNREWFVLDYGEPESSTKVLARCTSPTAAKHIADLLNQEIVVPNAGGRGWKDGGVGWADGGIKWGPGHNPVQPQEEPHVSTDSGGAGPVRPVLPADPPGGADRQRPAGEAPEGLHSPQELQEEAPRGAGIQLHTAPLGFEYHAPGGFPDSIRDFVAGDDLYAPDPGEEGG